MYSRREEDGAIAYDVRYNLSYPDACFFGRRSIRKRLRAHGIGTVEMHQPIREGDQEHLFDFDYKLTAPGKRWAEIRGVVHESYINLFCNGPQAEEVVAKVNAALYPWLRTERDDERARRAVARKEMLAKRRLRRRKMRKPRREKPKHADNDNKIFIPAPLAAKKKERLTPQFRNSSVTWLEAVRSVVSIFGIDRTPLFAARELVEFRLRRSLERNDVKFAQWKHDGFTLRFDTFDGMWRGDETELMVSCTKDKRHELYRRTRAHFADMLTGLSLERQKDRRARIAPINLLGTTSAIALSQAA